MSVQVCLSQVGSCFTQKAEIIPCHQYNIQENALCYTQYSAASFIETINSSSLTMDSDEFVARMIAAGVPDIEAASTQPMSPKLRPDPTPASPVAATPLIPAAPEDNLGLTPQPSQPSPASEYWLHTCTCSKWCHLAFPQPAELDSLLNVGST